jgi:hypothetical protein
VTKKCDSRTQILRSARAWVGSIQLRFSQSVSTRFVLILSFDLHLSIASGHHERFRRQKCSMYINCLQCKYQIPCPSKAASVPLRPAHMVPSSSKTFAEVSEHRIFRGKGHWILLSNPKPTFIGCPYLKAIFFISNQRTRHFVAARGTHNKAN